MVIHLVNSVHCLVNDLMNNVHYLVKAVESSPALAVTGEDWIEPHRDQASAERIEMFSCNVSADCVFRSCHINPGKFDRVH